MIGILGIMFCGLAIFVIALAGWGIALYNGLISLKNIVEEAWSGIEVQLKRRYDLIPNLVETVKGYAKHEKGTFEKVAELRTAAMGNNSVAKQGEIENQLSQTLKSIFAVAESYPELKANENFLDLQKQLSEIEDSLQNARRYYNGTVRDFNTKIQIFPNSLIANLLGFKARDFFEANEEEKKNVKVEF